MPDVHYHHEIGTPVWFMHNDELCCSPVEQVEIHLAVYGDPAGPATSVIYQVRVRNDDGIFKILKLSELEVAQFHETTMKRLREQARIHPTLQRPE